MGWFDSQIKERLEHDEDLVSQAAWDLSVAIIGRAAGGAEVDAGKAAADAVGEVLAYYRVKPADAPRDPKSVRDLIDAQLRGTGVMCRRVVLSKGWQRDAAGAMLGFVDGAPVALIPQPAGGFAYSDAATGEKVRVDRANAARLAQEAYCFYQPLPQRELGVRDVLLHMVRSLDLSDYVMIVAATLAVTLLGMLLPAVNSLIFGPVVDSGNVGVVVKTGCGKSTLMRLLLGFEKPQKGAVLYDGRDIETLDVASLRRNIGTVLQDGKLFTGDIFSNIVVAAPWLTMEDAWEAAELAGIADDIRAMPMGMNTMVSEGAGGISGGQRQRILIARAVAPKPKVLFFDEATSALDNVTQRQVSEALDRMKCTRIIVAHRLSTIRACDRIIVLDGGRVVEDGTYEELCALGGVFAELVERQTM